MFRRCLVGRFDVVSGIENFLLVEHLIVRLQTGIETREGALGSIEPRHFAECQQTREEAIFGLAIRRAGLGPEVRLRADDKTLATAHLTVRIERIDALDAADGSVAIAAHVRRIDFELGRRHLQLVEIVARRRHKHALKTFVGGCGGASVVPRHNQRVDGVGAVPMVDDLVPRHHFFAIILLQKTADDLHEPRLQPVHIAESFLFDAAFAVGIVFPLVGGTFVAADVDIVVGEHLGDVAEYAFQEVDGFVFSDIQNVLADAARNAHRIGFRRVATQFGIGRHGCHHMTGHIDFGNDFDVAFLGVGDDFAQVVERVEAAATIFRVVVERSFVCRVVTRHRTTANRANSGQFRVFGNLDAPALVVGQVPVETVEFVNRSDIEQFFYLILVEEVAAHVEHKSAIRHQRFVPNFVRTQAPRFVCTQFFSINRRRQHLPQCLKSIKKASEIAGTNRNTSHTGR